MSEYRFKIGDFAPTGPVEPKFPVEGITPTNHSSSPKTRPNDLSYGIKILTDFFTLLSQYTRLTDRQTEGQLSHRYTAFALHAAR